MKSIIFCADDYGQTQAISQAIIQLLQQKRLSATSCLVTSPLWSLHAQWLKDADIQADIGLHFNLTEGKPLSQAMQNCYGDSFPALSKVILNALGRKLNFNAILAELNAQIDAFVESYGQLPDYLDGHQHVHQLPIVRDVIFNVYEARLAHQAGFYMRCTHDSSLGRQLFSGAFIKQCAIQYMGALAFKSELLRRKIAHNASFAGIYTFKKSNQYPKIMNAFLSRISDNGLIMCHPGLEDQSSGDDAIYYSRKDEFDYLSSEEFLTACKKHQVVLTHISKR